jgi:RNase P subunit RPR2
MLTCATRDEAKRGDMESVHRGECRHCGREIVYDGHTMRLALAMPERRGRPVLFFCVQCFRKHDFSQVKKVVDDRGHKQREAMRQA